MQHTNNMQSLDKRLQAQLDFLNDPRHIEEALAQLNDPKLLDEAIERLNAAQEKMLTELIAGTNYGNVKKLS